MKPIEITALSLAERFVGIKETPGMASNPIVLAMLQLDQKWPEGDHVAWCSAFVNWIAWILNLPRSRSLAARSWLRVGTEVPLSEAEPGFDVAVFKRGRGPQPGPEVIDAIGHVAFYHSHKAGVVRVVGGNQSDAVTVAEYPTQNLLAIRRLVLP